jgi:hypothetical protein
VRRQARVDSRQPLEGAFDGLGDRETRALGVVRRAPSPLLRFGSIAVLRSHTRRDTIERPFAGHSPELVGPGARKFDSRASYELTHGAGDEDLIRCGGCLDTSGDMDPHPGDVIAAQLDLTRMDTRSNSQVEFPQDFLDCRRARNSSSGTIEDREKPVSGPSDEAATKTPKLTIDNMIVLIHEVAPASIAKGGHPLCRIHNVGKQYRRQNTLDGKCRSRSRDEFLDGLDVRCVVEGAALVAGGRPGARGEPIQPIAPLLQGSIVTRERPVEDGVTAAPARSDEGGI